MYMLILKEQDCETIQSEVQPLPGTETCVLVDSDDEDNSLRKTTKKTYKLCKKKSLEITEPTTAVQASESQEIAWEFAREITKIDAAESSEPASSEVVDMLSSYTRLLNKAKSANLGDISKDSEENSDELRQQLADKEESFENGSSTENSQQTVNIILEASSAQQVTDDGNCETELTVTSHGAADNRSNCSQNSTTAATSEPTIDSDNTGAVVRPIAANSEVISDGAQPEDTRVQQVLLVPTSAEDISDFKTWCCSLCTFKNSDFLRVCEICETPRYKSRRRSTNKNCSTNEFVARKQQKIFEKCSGIDQRNCGRKNRVKRSKGNNKGSVMVSGDNKKCNGGQTEDSTSVLVVANGGEKSTDSSSTEHLLEGKTETQSRHEVPVKPDSLVESTELLVKPEMDIKSVESSELNTSDVDLFSSPQPNVEVLEEIQPSPRDDEAMTSSCEDEIITSSCMSDSGTDLYGTESEFDDITDDDWWMCTSCKNYNYDDAADQCEACGLKKLSDHFDDLVTALEVDDDCWRCEDCGEFNFGDNVIRKCTKCSHGDKKGRKSLMEQYRNLRHLIVDDEEPEEIAGTSDEKAQRQFVKQEAIENLMFRPSSYTDRVYLYDGVRFAEYVD